MIFALMAGGAVGAGQLRVAEFGIVAVAAAAALFQDVPAAVAETASWQWLVVRIGWTSNLEPHLDAASAGRGDVAELAAVTTIRQGTAMELSYRVRLPAGLSRVQLNGDLNRVEVVQSVELKPFQDDDKRFADGADCRWRAVRKPASLLRRRRGSKPLATRSDRSSPRRCAPNRPSWRR